MAPSFCALGFFLRASDRRVQTRGLVVVVVVMVVMVVMTVVVMTVVVMTVVVMVVVVSGGAG